MAERCKNCGTELLAGQRFCRMCGAAISESQREELPTKIFPGEPQAAGSAAAHTAPQQRPGTDPFSPFQQGTAPQPPVPQQHTTPLYLPPDQPSSRSRAVMFLIVGLVGVSLLAVLLLAWNLRQSRQAKTTPPRTPRAESGIPVPPEPPSVEDERSASELDESDAVETDRETMITNTYTLSSSATFSIKGVNGNVTIEGWDQAQAEVKVIKRGGSIEDRKAVQVKSSHSDKLLSFEALPTDGDGVEVRYEVKLPRGLRQVEIKTVNAGVKVADMAGAVEVKAQNASVELEDVSGATTIKLVNGQIKASYDEKLAGPQELSTVNGKIEVELDDDIDANIDAHTVSGNIELDGDLEFKVEKKIVGQSASGRVGSGGQPISIKTVNGPITVSR
jgi:cytoskeletal protein RodZ